MNELDISRLKEWFLKDQRDLPWRNISDPYKVWVSEVMLQQTLVSVVIPYFDRWIKQFPTIKDLANAHLDDVIKAWEGLGYYSRARHLHEGAKQVLAEFGGVLPHEEHLLRKIKGLGPYTVNAIQAFAFRKPAAPVDGNVIRVLSRYYMIEEDVSKPKTIKSIQALADNQLPLDEPWIVSEALIELGATLCARRSKCSLCPLNGGCKALSHGAHDRLPHKSKKTIKTHLYRSVAIVTAGNRCLIRRGQKGEIMSDLHEFPYFEMDSKDIDAKAFEKRIQSEWKTKIKIEKPLSEAKHSFTRYEVHLSPFLFTSKKEFPAPGCEWKTFEELAKLAFSSGHRRLLHQLNTISKK